VIIHHDGHLLVTVAVLCCAVLLRLLQEIVTEDTSVGSNHFKASEDNPKVRVKSDKSGKEVSACEGACHDQAEHLCQHGAPYIALDGTLCGPHAVSGGILQVVHIPRNTPQQCTVLCFTL
jgi:hypothetical protein